MGDSSSQITLHSFDCSDSGDLFIGTDTVLFALDGTGDRTKVPHKLTMCFATEL